MTLRARSSPGTEGPARDLEMSWLRGPWVTREIRPHTGKPHPTRAPAWLMIVGGAAVALSIAFPWASFGGYSTSLAFGYFVRPGVGFFAAVLGMVAMFSGAVMLRHARRPSAAMALKWQAWGEAPAANRLRGIRSLLDLVRQMQRVNDSQHLAQESEVTPWVPSPSSPEVLVRLAMSRQLEGSLVPFGDHFPATSATRRLATSYSWSPQVLEDAADELTRELSELAPC